MEEKIYKITLGDGTEISNLTTTVRLSKDVAYHSKESDSKSIFTSITSCAEMVAGFYSVIFQYFMTASFTGLRGGYY